MAEKTLKTKIALLYRTIAEWNEHKDYVPLKGEVCICSLPAASQLVANEPCILIKVGDGEKSFEELPWLSAIAADVHEWAKKEHLDFEDLDETFLEKLDAYLNEKHLDAIWKAIEDEETRAKGAEQALDEKITSEISRAKAEEAKKPNIIEEGTNGTARLFNEKDGGGAKFEHKDGSEAFVGVNDGGKDGLMAQIYADIEENGQWVGSRINVFHDGIYYVSKAAQKAGSAKDDADREIATIGDIKALGKVLRFRGIFNSLDEVTDPQHGDVAIVGNKEYIYVVNETTKEGAWREFGDVSEYATKEELQAAIVELKGLISDEETRAKAAEEALDDKIEKLDESLAAIAKTGNVNDLIQTEGDVLILQCND